MSVWVSTSGGHIPENAIRAGYEEKENLCLFPKMEDTWISWKCSPDYEGAYIPNDGKEFLVKEYHVLDNPTNAVEFSDWKHASGGKVPDNAFKTDTDLYVGRVNFSGGLIPCTISTRYKFAYMGYGLEEHTTKK